ncbi:MAG: protein kinase [Acidobacteriota bacterium]|nr:protein kinase [Acidobacteriota bacterium]
MLAPGTRIGSYEIVGSLGAGGMGEVYRAKDPALGREVAIKVLPDAFATDPDRLARFEREAKALAAINHPNIAQVYGFERGPAEAGRHIGTALVMELLEGRTLRDVLSEGPLPPRKAIDYGAQLARGLAAAHDRGLIHRDLKPENIFVLTDGRIKILDFGLARQADAPISGATQTMTGAFRGTDPGTVMGTVGYMAPEQVRGAALDHRADLFALGAVIYEMIAGQRAFHRDTAAETMTAILREDPPDLSSSRAHLSPAIDRIVRHCLEKNPIERFQTARDVAFALDALSGSGSGSGAAVAAAPEIRSNRERWTWAAAVTTLLAAVTWLALQPGAADDTAPPAPMRLMLMLPEGVRLTEALAVSTRLGMSPDGQRLAYIGVDASNQRSLWLHQLREPLARKVDDTIVAAGPVWSPDSTALLFGVFGPAGTALRKLAIEGGNPVTIADRGGWAAWAPDGTILLEPVRGQTELLRTTSSGGPVTPAVPALVNGSRNGHLSFLPDGRHYLHRFLAPGSATLGTYVGSLDSPDRHLVLSGNDISQAVVANGMLMFARNTTLLAQPFDSRAFTTTGEPVVIAEGVEQNAIGAAFTVSRTGTLAYQPSAANLASRLRWFDRKGAALGTLADDSDYSNLELSPDGRRMLVSVRAPGATARDIYIVDTVRGLRQRLTFDPSDERSAVWSADGTSVIYNSKGLDLYQRSAGFTGGETAVLTDGISKDPSDVSPDGRQLLFRASSTESGNDVWTMPLDGSAPPQRVLGSGFNENGAQFSPDGRSIVFLADDSGRPEVYVMSLEPGGGKTQISIDGGSSPRWRRDGQEILYLNADRSVMSVPVKGSGAQFEAGTPARLFDVDHVPSAGPIFDVTADGQRFIVNTAVPSKVPPHVVVVVNWPSLLNQAGLRKP